MLEHSSLDFFPSWGLYFIHALHRHLAPSTGLNDCEILWVVTAYVCQHMQQLDVINLCLPHHQNYRKNSRYVDKSYPKFNDCLFARYRLNNIGDLFRE